MLDKKPAAMPELKALYAAYVNDFSTLFDFGENTQTYRTFADEEHFCRCYPFVPYQFDLFQHVIQSLSDHHAFEGQYRSVGERSMLSVFKHVACLLQDEDVGHLATFDLMFDGLKSTLTSIVQRSVIQAERALGAHNFAVRLLKALFLVKYVKGFKSTVRNLRVLMTPTFDQNIPALEKQISNALKQLENESYVQSNGTEYEYLTDEEKDVEMEIKATIVDLPDMEKRLYALLFSSGPLPDRKFRCGTPQKDYVFTHKLDTIAFSKE